MPIIDVRSPGEFAKAHIPGAHNIPLFSDHERAVIGTAYKQESPERAIELGYQFVNPKKDELMQRALELSAGGRAVVHCWRGGMRSKAFAEEMVKFGGNEIHQLIGGYKSFRRLSLEHFARKLQLVVLGGYTGSGKTRILHELKNRDHQVVDLEGLAMHRGSAFGGVTSQQPSTEHFENLLFFAIKDLDPSRPVWVEDEGHVIGSVRIPMEFFEQMKDARLMFLDIPKEERARLLVEEYESMDPDFLEGAIGKISKRLGGLVTKQSLEHLYRKEYYEVALLCLNYYDKYYKKSLDKRSPEQVTRIEAGSTDSSANSDVLLTHIKDHEHE